MLKALPWQQRYEGLSRQRSIEVSHIHNTQYNGRSELLQSNLLSHLFAQVKSGQRCLSCLAFHLPVHQKITIASRRVICLFTASVSKILSVCTGEKCSALSSGQLVVKAVELKKPIAYGNGIGNLKGGASLNKYA